MRPVAAAFVLSFLPVLAGAQTPMPKTPPRLPSINIPSVDYVMIMSTPNMKSNDPFALFPGQQARMRVGLASVPKLKIGVLVSYSNPAISGPPSVSIGTGQLFADFMVTANSVNEVTNLTISAWTIDRTRAKNAAIRVMPQASTCQPTPRISAPLAVQRGTTATISITLSCAPAAPTQVQISTSASTILPPPPGNVITIPAGSTSGGYSTPVGYVSASTTVTISAYLVGSNPIVSAPATQLAVVP